MPIDRHFTAAAVVIDANDRVLLVHHNKLRKWIYPGGHIEPDESPDRAAIREVLEETNVLVEIIDDDSFAHPAVKTIRRPFAILDIDSTDADANRHHHIELVYVARPVAGEIAPRLSEVSACRWMPISDVQALDAPAELSDLVLAAARWSCLHQESAS
jgi:8-oxo-dGTP diphosphatase